MKTCALGFLKDLRWYYRTLLSLVSVPLSSMSKEMEGLNVFATATISRKGPHPHPTPNPNLKFKASTTCFSAVPETSAPCLRCLWSSQLHLKGVTPKAADVADAHPPPHVTSQPLVDGSDCGAHQKEGFPELCSRGTPILPLNLGFPFFPQILRA